MRAASRRLKACSLGPFGLKACSLGPVGLNMRVTLGFAFGPSAYSLAPDSTKTREKRYKKRYKIASFLVSFCRRKQAQASTSASPKPLTLNPKHRLQHPHLLHPRHLPYPRTPIHISSRLKGPSTSPLGLRVHPHLL